MKLSITLVFLLASQAWFLVARAGISQKCLDCICEVEGCESQEGKCSWDVYSDSCGPFQIKEPYWTDCGEPGEDWRSCTKERACSEDCVRNYMDRYGTYCTEDRTPTCEDYAKIHNGGPRGCRKSLESYWSKVEACCDRGSGRC